jgi:hypothetical protein
VQLAAGTSPSDLDAGVWVLALPLSEPALRSFVAYAYSDLLFDPLLLLGDLTEHSLVAALDVMSLPEGDTLARLKAATSESLVAPTPVPAPAADVWALFEQRRSDYAFYLNQIAEIEPFEVTLARRLASAMLAFTSSDTSASASTTSLIAVPPPPPLPPAAVVCCTLRLVADIPLPTSAVAPSCLIGSLLAEHVSTASALTSQQATVELLALAQSYNIPRLAWLCSAALLEQFRAESAGSLIQIAEVTSSDAVAKLLWRHLNKLTLHRIPDWSNVNLGHMDTDKM